MGAYEFTTHAVGSDVTLAFESAREEAQHENGHGGYTGTIAEKHDVVVLHDLPMSRIEAGVLANQLLEDDDARISDKWGPAGAIRTDDGWLFFGWASS